MICKSAINHRLSLLLFILIMAENVHAEPGASMSHIPYLWGLDVVFSVLLSWVTVKVIGRFGYLKTPLKRWVLAFILFAVFVIFSSPIIVGLGSILVTGRTM